MDLVICNTPLQVLQIENLLKLGILKKNNFELIFFVYNETEKLTYYYNRLKKMSSNSIYYKYKKFPFYVYDLKKIFKGKIYNSIYTASIDNKLNHYILSFSIFKGLYTIDDGTANIWRNSSYYVENKNMIKSLLHYSLGCKFDLVKTKEKIKKHYTIYKDQPNIIENTIYNEMFTSTKKSNFTSKSINIFLGTVYEEVTLKKEDLIHTLDSFLSQRNFYYIPHPRDNEHYFKNVLYIESEKISEEIISNMLDEYCNINLYGFGSSVQFNLLHIDGINNFQLVSSHLKRNIIIPNFSLEKINIDRAS
ncbi:glycosyltransferase family 52 [Escherichia coli]|uniref:glycosyltransferase family 52 n=1 Tax=Escherichia coli TaxID=562 RepID=UPI0012E20ABD|nr:glycosyltransferase family 52 [Escherichia coli]QGU42289.1 hypothetical protein GAG93_05195 [Escherichia coli]